LNSIRFVLSWFRSFPNSARRLLLKYMPFNLFLVALDLAASISAGLLIAVATVDEANRDGVLRRLGPLYKAIGSDPSRFSTITLLVCATLLIFSFRVILSIMLQGRVAQEISKVSTSYVEKVLFDVRALESSWLEKEDKSKLLRILHVGTSTFIVNGIINFQALFQEFLLLCLVIFTLARVDVFILTVVLLFLVAGAIFSNILTLKRARVLVKKIHEANSELQKSFFSFLDFFLELRLGHRFEKASQRVIVPFSNSTLWNAKQGITIGMSRQIIEIWGILAICVIVGLSATKSDESESAVILGVFIVGLSRIVPAIQRLNSSWVALNTSKEIVLELWKFTNYSQFSGKKIESVNLDKSSKTRSPAAVKLERAKLVIDNRVIFQDLAFEIGMGERLLVCGNSGVGKSSLLYVLAGHLKLSSGTLQIDEMDLSTYVENNPSKVAILRSHREIYGATIRDNIGLEREFSEIKTLRDAKDLMLIKTSNREFLGERYTSFSQGERQRIDILRSIIHEPNLILMDEPTSNLNRKIENAVMKKLSSLKATQVLVTHSVDVIQSHEGKILFMIGDSVSIMGSIRTLLQDSRFRDFLQKENYLKLNDKTKK